MSGEETRDLVIQMLHRVARGGVPDPLDDDIPLNQQIHLDSMDFLDLAIEIRKQTNVMIPEAEFRTLRTLGSLVDYISPRRTK